MLKNNNIRKTNNKSNINSKKNTSKTNIKTNKDINNKVNNINKLKTTITDNSYIKNYTPRKNSHYHQGIIKPSQCTKLFESCSNDNIIYRSGLELKFIKWCEMSNKVIRWGSEPICINYLSRTDNKIHRYYPDFMFEHESGTKYIVEIKPYAQTIKPKSSSSDWDKKTWIKNTDKWRATIEFCSKQKNIKFIIITEKFFDNL